jgi:hypothetical protein
VTLTNVKTFIGISGSGKDDLLNLLIDQAGDLFESATGRTFEETTYTNEEYDGTGNRELQLKNYPIITFTRIQYRNTYDNTDSWTTINTSDYWVENDTGIITRTTTFSSWDVQFKDPQLTDEPTWSTGANNYRATYTAGYATIPSDIQMAVMGIVSGLYNLRASAGIESETKGDRTVRLADVDSILSNGYIGRTINQYKDQICSLN